MSGKELSLIKQFGLKNPGDSVKFYLTEKKGLEGMQVKKPSEGSKDTLLRYPNGTMVRYSSQKAPKKK